MESSIAFSTPSDTALPRDFVVVYSQASECGDGSTDIWAQRVSQDGKFVGKGLLLCSAAGTQRNPRIAFNSKTNEFLVVWTDFRNAGNGSDIYGRRIKFYPSTGYPLAPSGLDFAICSTTGDQVTPDLAACTSTAAGADDFLVTWWDKRSGYQSYGRRLIGATLQPEFQVCASSSRQQVTVPAYNSKDNKYLIVWTDDATSVSPNYRLRGRMMDPTTGTLLAVDWLDPTASPVSQGGTFDVTYSHTPNNPSGRNQFLVSWGDYATLLDNNGGFLNHIGPFSTAGNLFRTAYSETDDEFLVTWSDTVAPNHAGGQRLEVVGTTLQTVGSNFTLCTGVAGSVSETVPAGAYNPDGNEFLTTWTDKRYTPRFDVFAQRWKYN